MNTWIETKNNETTIGLTKQIQKELDEITYIEMPEIESNVKKDQAVVILETSKSAIEIYTPLPGKITQINENLQNNPQILKTLTEEESWLFKLTQKN